MSNHPDRAPLLDSPKSLIIDVDRHVQETWDIFQKYADREFRERVYQRVTLSNGSSGLAIDGRLMPGWSGAMWDDPAANRFFEDDRFWPNNPDVKLFDVRTYLADMDREGIDAAIIIPTLALGNGTIPDGQLGAALCRSYVRWISEFCAAAGKRLLPIAPVNLYDVGQAVTDGKWAVEKMGMCGFLVPALPVDGSNLDHPSFFPFWAMAQDLDVPVHIHSISSLPDANGRGPLVDVMAGVGRFGGNVFFHHLISHRVEQHFATLTLIAGGVLERFPGLRLVFAESGGGWFASWLEDMDSHYSSSMRKWVPWLKSAPSEYFSRQCLIAFDAGESTLGATAPLVGVENVAWFSDYPHYDCIFPGAVDSVCRNMASLPAEDQRKILGENAARLYKLSPI